MPEFSDHSTDISSDNLANDAEQVGSGDNDTEHYSPKIQEATTQEDIEAKVNNLQKQMYVITGQLHQICDTMAKFVKCKSCQKKKIIQIF